MNRKLVYVFGFITGFLIAAGFSVYAAVSYNASNVLYNGEPLNDVLDHLYGRTDQIITKGDKTCVFISNQYGEKGEIGAKYMCNLGDGVARNFYLLKKDTVNNRVKLIMENNITSDDGLILKYNWDSAVAFFNSSSLPGYNLKQSWSNVISVGIPDANDILDATLAINPKENWSYDFSGTASWFCLGNHEKDNVNGATCQSDLTSQRKVAWLFNFIRNCAVSGCDVEYPNSGNYPYGYWTTTRAVNGTASFAYVIKAGWLSSESTTNDAAHGVRPVITINSSQI